MQCNSFWRLFVIGRVSPAMCSSDFSKLWNLTLNFFRRRFPGKKVKQTQLLVTPGEDQALALLRTLLRKGTGKGRPPAQLPLRETCKVAAHETWLGLAMKPPWAWVSIFLWILILWRTFALWVTNERSTGWSKSVSHLWGGREQGRWQPVLEH